MDVKKLKILILETPYHNRVMMTIIFSQVLVLLIFKLWPINTLGDLANHDIIYTDSINILQVEITQQQTAAAPPKPQIPVPVPNDEVIDEDVEIPEEIEFLTLEYSQVGESVGKAGDSDKISSNPQLPPNPNKIVEPPLPKSAKDARIKVEILVTFLVDREGSVQEAFIAEIRLYDKDGKKYEVVEGVGHNLAEVTIDAAMKWKFRPAKDQGSIVRSYTTQSFKYGF